MTSEGAPPRRGGLFLRAVVAFLALPGVVAFVVPFLLAEREGHEPVPLPLGGALFVLGTIALLGCVRDFYVAGRGTLAPWAPPMRLVRVGLYRFSRNPMYLSVLLVLVAWAVTFRSLALALYAVAVALAFHLRVVYGEEPWLAKRHGDAWHAYAAVVPRWLLRLPTFGNRGRRRGVSFGEEEKGMEMTGIPFEVTEWSLVAPTTHPGERGVATWRTRQCGAIRVRMVEYSPGYLADHWCSKGHVLLCVEGELQTELRDGRTFTLRPGTSYQVADGAEPHRSSTAVGARLFIVD